MDVLRVRGSMETGAPLRANYEFPRTANGLLGHFCFKIPVNLLQETVNRLQILEGGTNKLLMRKLALKKSQYQEPALQEFRNIKVP